MIKKVFKIIGYILLVIVILIIGVLSYVKFALPHVGPAPDIHITATPARLARGKYLVNHVAGCIFCHSRKDYSLYGSPIIPGTEGEGGEVFGYSDSFPGNFIAKNITPYHLGNWTDGELFRAVTTGENKDGKALFPIMPYQHYAVLDTEDIYSILVYIRTLKSIPKDNPESSADFPVNFILNTIPTKADFHPRPLASDSAGYGKYLVTMGSCTLCHTPQVKGQPIPGMDFAGGMGFPMVTGGTLNSANITPDMETGIGSWTREAFIARFKSAVDSSNHPGPAPKDGYNPVMPWQYYGGMTEEDLGDIYAYLRTVKPVHNLVVKMVK